MSVHAVALWLLPSAVSVALGVWIWEPLRLALKQMRRREAAIAIGLWAVAGVVAWLVLR